MVHAHAYKHGALSPGRYDATTPSRSRKGHPKDLSPQDSFLVARNRFPELVDAVNNAQTTDRRLSTDRMTLEKDRNDVSALISENPE